MGERWNDDELDAEGPPPALLLWLHNTYNNPSSEERSGFSVLSMLPTAIEFNLNLLEKELMIYLPKVALLRHRWAMTALGFQSIEDFTKWAKDDPERLRWAQTSEGYCGWPLIDNH